MFVCTFIRTVRILINMQTFFKILKFFVNILLITYSAFNRNLQKILQSKKINMTMRIKNNFKMRMSERCAFSFRNLVVKYKRQILLNLQINIVINHKGTGYAISSISVILKKKQNDDKFSTNFNFSITNHRIIYNNRCANELKWPSAKNINISCRKSIFIFSINTQKNLFAKPLSKTPFLC